MKTHLLLCRHFGENSSSDFTPVSVFDPVTADPAILEQTKSVCISYDNDMLISQHEYCVVEVILPDWMEPSHFIRHATDYKYLWGVGVDPAWPETWQRGLRHLGSEMAFHLSKILKVKTFRNEFRKKLRDQVVEWLETDPDDRKFASPLSHKQMECLIVRTWEYKQITQGLYRSRSVSSIGRLVPTAEVLSICEAALNASMFDLEPAL